jgi:glycosyltransferase involved in cell wall biosynthesis
MIYYDITKMGAAKHRSGLMRVTSRLQQEMGASIVPVRWEKKRRAFVTAESGNALELSARDWLFTVELFGEDERPGFTEFVRTRACRFAAMFHDAIPLRWPHITWPQSVQRHPGYMKLLAEFDRVFAISEASRADLTGFWNWQGVEPRAVVSTVELGADFDGNDRRVTSGSPANDARASLLCVGIVEPRKNQMFLLDVAERLWSEQVDFDLHVVGRINPHFGKPIAQRMRALQRREQRFRFHEAASDEVLARLYADATAVIFPTIAEGCGLPLLEALWRGVPCVCSDLPSLLENTQGGGCLIAAVNDDAAWRHQLRLVITDASEVARLRQEAATRPLGRWSETARRIVGDLERA